MKKQILIIGGIILIGIFAWFLSTGGNTADTQEVQVEDIEAAGDPVDATLAFYRSWLDAVLDDTQSPFTSGLLDDSILSDDVRTYIEGAMQTDGTINGVDPVLCQSVTPDKLRAKATFVLNDKAEVMVLGRGTGEKSSEQAAVRLAVVDGAWSITNIGCYSGESAPEKEFAFEQEGYLLKSVPAPLDSRYWHLVFEQNGEKGHTVPLFFDAESTCIAIDESEAVCDENTFNDADKVFVQAQMTEAGAQVKRLQFFKEE